MKMHIAVLGLLLGSAGLGVCATDDTAAPPAKWKVSADLEEACSCRAACPCWFKSNPSRMTCDGVQAVFIQKGRHGRTSLDGLALAQFVQSP